MYTCHAIPSFKYSLSARQLCVHKGLSLALALSDHGANVYAGSRSKSLSLPVKRSFEEKGIAYIPLDASKEKDIENMV